MPTVLRNGRVLTESPTSPPTRTAAATATTATQLPPARPTGLLLLLYPLILLLGTLFSVLSPVAVPAPGTHPDQRAFLHQVNYFAGKRNVFNVYFVKLGWLWTTLAFTALQLTSPSPPASKSRLYTRAAVRYGIVTLSWILTTQWLFGPPLVDRSFTITGGHCEVPTGTVSVLSSAACKAAGGRWRGGHDVSGHIFMLTLASAFLLYELYIADTHSDHASVTPAAAAKVAHELSDDERRDLGGWESETAAKLRIYARYLVWAVIGLALWMFMMTAIWFHTWQEKFSALLLAEATIWSVYFLSDWVPALKSVVGGFD